ncbi:MAG: hypothetical protein KIT68_11220, partial [Phycisphaeraceae bacterium]|nr:hypothetical protein [Phycisphaeraceae bacterium]
MAKRRLGEIAKELNVPVKAIIDKCLAEEIPADTVKTHASMISAGLEATIREWFSEAAAGTAVETKEHVDVTKVRAVAKPAKSRAKKAGGSDASASTAVAEPPAKAAPAAPDETPPSHEPEHVEAKSPPRTARPLTPAAPAAPVVSAPAAPATPIPNAPA